MISNAYSGKIRVGEETTLEKYLSDIGMYVVVDSFLSDGARTKYWCHSGNSIYLYKEDKVHPGGEKTFESVSEYLAMILGDLIGVPVVQIVLGNHYILSKVMRNEEVHSFIEYSEEFSHSFHMSNLKTYTLGTLLSDKNKYKRNVIEMLLFDILIGNSDRHPGNFGYTSRGFYPLFDNGSSLCAYVKESTIADLLRDKAKFKALCYSKSRPTIRGESKLTHYDLLKQLDSLFPEHVSKFCRKIQVIDLDFVLSLLPISEDRKYLLRAFLEERVSWFEAAGAK